MDGGWLTRSSSALSPVLFLILLCVHILHPPHQETWWGGCTLWTPSRIKNKTCQRENTKGVPCEPTAIHILCPTVSADVLMLLGYFLEEVRGRFCTPATVKPFTPQNTKTQRDLKTHSVGGHTMQLLSAGQLTG